MKTNLMIVEGLSESEKSMTASMITEELKKKGKTVICVGKGEQNHLTGEDVSGFKVEWNEVLEYWHSFMIQAEKDTVYVLWGSYHWNFLCEAMRQFDEGEEEAKVYITEITEIIKSLKPIFIYIDEANASAIKDGISDYEGSMQSLAERRMRELQILRELDLDYYTISQDICVKEFEQLCVSAGWGTPSIEQMQTAIENSTKSFVIRYKGRAIAMIHWLGDYGMHWLMKEFVVHKNFQGQMIGTFLYRYSENFIKSTMKPGWKVCIDLRSAQGKEPFYQKLGFQLLTEQETGSGMEKMIEWITE